MHEALLASGIVELCCLLLLSRITEIWFDNLLQIRTWSRPQNCWCFQVKNCRSRPCRRMRFLFNSSKMRSEVKHSNKSFNTTPFRWKWSNKISALSSIVSLLYLIINSLHNFQHLSCMIASLHFFTMCIMFQ